MSATIDDYRKLNAELLAALDVIAWGSSRQSALPLCANYEELYKAASGDAMSARDIARKALRNADVSMRLLTCE